MADVYARADQDWARDVLTIDLGLCGCGGGTYDGAPIADTVDAAWLVRKALAAMPLYGSVRADPTWLTSWAYVLLSAMTDAGLIEHGGNIHGSWITPKGQRLLDLMPTGRAISLILDPDDPDEDFVDIDAPKETSPMATRGESLAKIQAQQQNARRQGHTDNNGNRQAKTSDTAKVVTRDANGNYR